MKSKKLGKKLVTSAHLPLNLKTTNIKDIHKNTGEKGQGNAYIKESHKEKKLL